ncbi:MAG: transglutaminase-like domain-containing protein [Limisphaerales bacterium]
MEEACWLLACTVNSDINTEAYRAVLDDYAHDLMQRIDFGSEPEGIMAAINRYLFQTQRYQGNEDNYYSADNSYLNRVIDQRTGNPISLCIIYQLVGRRLGLPVTGIGLPGHFLCRFQTPRQDYYIDAFNKGRLLTKTDCMKYLKQAGYEYHEAFLMPASSRRILLRMCSNLHQIYQRDNQTADAARLHGYIVALSK